MCLAVYQGKSYLVNVLQIISREVRCTYFPREALSGCVYKSCTKCKIKTKANVDLISSVG